MQQLKKKWFINIDWSKELTKLNIDNETVEKPEGRISSLDCPYCPDEGNKKGYIVWGKGIFKCFRHNDHATNGFNLLVKLGANTVELEKDYKAPRNDLFIDKSIIEKTVRIFKECINDRDWAKPFRQALRDRCITKEMCEKYEIGFQTPYHRTKPYRISIPITDSDGRYILQRLYLPSECSPQGEYEHSKFLNSPKGNKSSLFPIDQLQYNKILICGGELKAILAATLLNPHGIGAITTTGGEGKSYAEYSSEFKDKEVYVCMDVDDKGQESEEKVCSILFHSSKRVFRSSLPLDLKEEHPKGDINDFVKDGGDLLELIKDAKEFVLPSLDLSKNLLDAEKETNLLESVSDVKEGWVHAEGILTSISTQNHSIPQRITPTCPRNQDTLCFICPISQKKPGESYLISPDREEVLLQIGEEREKQKKIFKKMFEVPIKCPVFDYKVNNSITARFGRIRPSQTGKEISALVLNNIDVDNMSNLIEFRGYICRFPKNNITTVVITEEIPSAKSLKYFELDEDTSNLVSNNINSVEEVWSKLRSRYNAMSHNLTRIYDYLQLHFTADLVFHSFPKLKFNGKSITGMLDVCILGDTGQGKSEVTKSLLSHTGNMGEIIDSSRSSVPGLTLAADRGEHGFLVRYGTLPRLNNKLALFEETDSLPKDVMKQLKFVRSEGIVKLDKVVNDLVPANVRMLYVTNPGGNRQVIPNSTKQLIALENLFGEPASLRRCDFVFIVWNDPNRKRLPDDCTYPDIYNVEVAKAQLMWAWSRKEEDVTFTDDAVESILKYEREMCDKYTDEIPLVMYGDMRNKLARMSAACAAITFSNIVTKYHVEVIVDFMIRHYDSPECSYKLYSDEIKLEQTVLNRDKVIEKMKLKNLLIRNIITSYGFTTRDFIQWVEDRTIAVSILNQLQESHVIRKVKDSKSKTGDEQFQATVEGIKLLQEIKEKDGPPQYL